MPETYQSVLDVIGKVLMALALVTGAIAILDWAIRTRRINPFSPVARFFRRWIDPLLKPLETMIVRRGGQPANAPFIAFMIIVVVGIVMMQLLRVIFGLVMQMSVGMSSPRMFTLMLIAWTLRFLTFALLVRVVSSWLPVSPYSKWIRWSYVSTDWLVGPIRRVLPPFGAIDFSPLVAYLILIIAGRVIGV
jgi:YggT family protein